MNLYLNGIGNGYSPVGQGDALANKGDEEFKLVLTNPPFGKSPATKWLAKMAKSVLRKKIMNVMISFHDVK